GSLSKDICQLGSFEREANLGARDVGVGNCSIEGGVKRVAAFPIAAEKDRGVEVVVGTGFGGQDGLYGYRRGGTTDGFDPRDKELAEGVFRRGAAVEQLA